MSTILTLARRELSAYFLSPIAYVVLAVFLALTGFFFGRLVFEPGQPATMRMLFEQFIPYILFFALPIITMRLVSEELRSGTIESLMTAPVTDTQVVLGKFLGVFAFYMAMLASTVIYWIMLALHGDPDFGATVAGYIGLTLLGATYLAIGLFFSTCTRNQMIAGLSSMAVIGLFFFLPPLLAQEVTGKLRVLVQHASLWDHHGGFVRGMLDLNHLLFFASTIVLFLFLSVKVLESKRWR